MVKPAFEVEVIGILSICFLFSTAIEKKDSEVAYFCFSSCVIELDENL